MVASPTTILRAVSRASAREIPVMAASYADVFSAIASPCAAMANGLMFLSALPRGSIAEVWDWLPKQRGIHVPKMYFRLRLSRRFDWFASGPLGAVRPIASGGLVSLAGSPVGAASFAASRENGGQSTDVAADAFCEGIATRQLMTIVAKVPLSMGGVWPSGVPTGKFARPFFATVAPVGAGVTNRYLSDGAESWRGSQFLTPPLTIITVC